MELAERAPVTHNLLRYSTMTLPTSTLDSFVFGNESMQKLFPGEPLGSNACRTSSDEQSSYVRTKVCVAAVPPACWPLSDSARSSKMGRNTW